MAIEEEVYEEILGKAVTDARERFPQRFMRYNYDKNKGWTELGTVTINDFIEGVYKNYEDNHLMEGDSIMSKEAREASFAANRALQIMYGVAASEDIKRNINNFFDDKKNNAWFEKKGITGDEKTALRKKLTSAVDEQILGADKSKSNKKLVSSIQRIYKD